MVAKNRTKVSEKKRRVKVGKLGTTKELSAAEKKRVGGGTGTGGGTGKVTFKEFTITKTTDTSTP